MNLAAIKDDVQSAELEETVLAYKNSQVISRRASGKRRSAVYDDTAKGHMVIRSFPKMKVPKLQRMFVVPRERPIDESDFERWLSYLSRLSEDPVGLPGEHARAVRVVWSKLNSLVENIRPPAAEPGGELGFQLTWNTSRYYLDIDIARDGRFEWFFTDRTTKEEFGSDDDLLPNPPEELVQFLVRVCRDT